ncbi:conserved hypothetical protein [Pseudomonas aeruginosa 2192]|nr:conserved hypothetical protein [Pseudomonas aeruginosa 2192]
MPQDMSQFLQVFFEETEEHLATLELLLIGLDLDRPDSETLHGIFRAAHSIKGSSGMFGFDDITAVTHELETLLDAHRSGSPDFRGAVAGDGRAAARLAAGAGTGSGGGRLRPVR